MGFYAKARQSVGVVELDLVHVTVRAFEDLHNWQGVYPLGNSYSVCDDETEASGFGLYRHHWPEL